MVFPGLFVVAVVALEKEEEIFSFTCVSVQQQLNDPCVVCKGRRADMHVHVVNSFPPTNAHQALRLPHLVQQFLAAFFSRDAISFPMHGVKDAQTVIQC
jgi:hypothetical protein